MPPSDAFFLPKAMLVCSLAGAAILFVGVLLVELYFAKGDQKILQQLLVENHAQQLLQKK